MEDKFNIVYDRLKDLSLDQNILCGPFWKKVIRLRENFNEDDCLQMVIENIEWLINQKVVTTAEVKKWIIQGDVLDVPGQRVQLIQRGEIQVQGSLVIAMGGARVRATGHSLVMLFDSARCQAHDTTHVKGYHNSSFILNDCTGEAFDRCSATARGYSKLELWGQAHAVGENYSYLILHDESKAESHKNVHMLRQ